MKTLLAKESDLDFKSPKLLATLRDHFGSINCVRWARSGRCIASGSDDSLVLIHERKPGSGTVEFGSGEPPNVENWKVTLTLRGHSADVVDLSWSPDDSMVASCSLDNTVRIWRTTDGSSVTVLNDHKSLVKGVAWDPIGSFLASQSDDNSAIIWQTSNWTLTHRAEGPWEKTVSSTFFRRLGWSPCGHFLTTTHGFQKPSHTAPVLERGNWSATFNFVGHNAAVVVVRFNHSVFRTQTESDNPGTMQGLEANNVAKGAVADGTSKNVSKGASVYNVIALGSQDCYITVWTTASPRPVFVGKHFFSQSVVDLSWSPDGYSLFCCSLDGSIAAFHFEPKELGQRISDAEMEDLKKSRYGDLQNRHLVLAESPAQLTLEAAALKEVDSVSSQIKKCRGVIPAAPNGAPKPLDHVPMDTCLDKGIVPTTTPEKVGGLASSRPVQQREYRRPDGRRRIIPEALGVLTQDDNIVNGGGIIQTDLPASTVIPSSKLDDEPENTGLTMPEVGEKRIRSEEFSRGDLSKKKSNGAFSERGVSSTANTSAVNVINFDVRDAPRHQSGLVKGTADLTRLDGVLSVKVRGCRDVGEDSGPVCLEAKPAKAAEKDEAQAGELKASRYSFSETNIICSQGGEIWWSDRLTGKVTVLTGNANFWAAGCEDGSLQIYTTAGRRAFPSMLIGSGVAFLDCDDQWKLLSLTTCGILYVWDILQTTCILQDSVIPLLKGNSSSRVDCNNTVKIISARFSQAGFPMIVLANHHAFLFHMNMRCWLRVADDMFPASNFASTVSAEEGELSSLQAAAGVVGERNFMWSRSVIDEKCRTRAHLEAQMAAALSLESAVEYRRYLLAYARFITREADEARLRELCESLLGPPHVPIENGFASLDLSRGNWDPRVIGMKKKELLKTDVLPAMASNRAVQRLLNEFIDLLSEYDARQPKSPPST